MSMQTGETPAANGRVRRLSPDEVRRHTFARAPLSRRGFDDDEVVEFLAAVADQVAAMETEIEQVGDENRRLKHAMREWHRQQVGYDSAELMARTQQDIEEQIARAESYSREREEEAARRYEAIVAEAYQRAEEALAARGGPATGEQPVAEPPVTEPPVTAFIGAPAPVDREVGAAEQLQVDGLLRALDGLAAHIDAARSLFARDAGVSSDEADDSQGSLFPSDDDGDGPAPSGLGPSDGGPGNGAAAPGDPALRPDAFGGVDEWAHGGPRRDVQGDVPPPPPPPGPLSSVEAGGGRGRGLRDTPSHGEEVERQDGFEVRRQAMPRPAPRPARTPPGGTPTADGPDGPVTAV